MKKVILTGETATLVINIEIRAEQFAKIQEAVKTLESSNSVSELILIDVVTHGNVFELKNYNEDICKEDIDLKELKEYEFRLEEMKISLQWKDLYLSFESKHGDEVFFIIESISFSELEKFYTLKKFKDELNRADGIELYDSPILTYWDVVLDDNYDLISTKWEEDGLEYEYGLSEDHIDLIEYKDNSTYLIKHTNGSKNNDAIIKLLGIKSLENNNQHYCNICCMETSFDEQNNCDVCGNPLNLEISEKDEEINNLTYKNKNMALALKNLGFNQDQISSICYGSFGMLRAWMDTENSIEESEYIVNVAVTNIVSGKHLSEIHEYNLITENGANQFIQKINGSILMTLNDAIFVYSDITDDELKL